MSSMQPPDTPFVVQTSLTTIDEATSADQARSWTLEIEARYDGYFGNPEPTWTWNEVHDLDRDALIELEEVVRASRRPPIDLDLVSSFRTPDWRKPYQAN